MDLLHDPLIQQSIGTIILALATLLGTAVTSVGLSLLRSHLSAQQFKRLQDYAGLAVTAAEQAGAAGLVKDKKTSALVVLQDYLNGAGLTGFTAQQLDAAIEAAVFREINQFEAPAVQPAPEGAAAA